MSEVVMSIVLLGFGGFLIYLIFDVLRWTK